MVLYPCYVVQGGIVWIVVCMHIKPSVMLDARSHGEPILIASSICVILHKQASDEIKEAICKSVIRATDESFALRGPGIMTIDKKETNQA